jgi:hypothetical protein
MADMFFDLNVVEPMSPAWPTSMRILSDGTVKDCVPSFLQPMLIMAMAATIATML